MSAVPAPPVTSTELDGELPPLAWKWLVGIGAVLLLVAIVLADRYGYHRDELYFVSAGRRLSWGYVDQPPFTPAVSRVAEMLFGDSLRGLRFFAALGAAVSVVLTGVAARELGGRQWAQLLAAGAAALTPLFHTPALMISTATFDFAAWAAILVLVLRMLRSRNDLLWIPIGVIAGVGLLNKHTVAFLGVALAISLLLTSQRRILLSGYALVGVAIALVLWSPNLWWQYQHDWPVFEMSEALNTRNGGLLNLVLFIPAEFALTGVFSAMIWGWGLLWLLRSPEAKQWRPLGLLPLVLFGIFVVVGGKPYYLAPVFVVLFAAGAVVISTQSDTIRRWAVTAAVISGIVDAPPSLPIIPDQYLDTVIGMNAEFGEMYGWPELVEQVTDVVGDLPTAQRENAVIVTQNYGEFGALERYGDPARLPDLYSGHNNIWLWGQPAESTQTVVAVGIASDQLQHTFQSCDVVHIITNPADIDNEESGDPITVCTGPTRPWSEIWAGLRHYN